VKTSWTERAVEDANLFNPAFCSLLLARAAEDYGKKSKSDLPYAIAFLILPIVLHRSVRDALPGSTVTALVPWLQDHREQLIDFPERVRRMLPTTQEALLFGCQHEVLILTSSAGLQAGKGRHPATEARTPYFTDETNDCLYRAGFLGRWFATAGSIATIYASWGIAP
jgi:hypothetical protein